MGEPGGLPSMGSHRVGHDWRDLAADILISIEKKKQNTHAQKKTKSRDFPGGPVVKNLPCNTEDMGTVPGWGTRNPHAISQLSLCVTMRRCCELQLGPNAANKQILLKTQSIA